MISPTETSRNINIRYVSLFIFTIRLFQFQNYHLKMFASVSEIESFSTTMAKPSLVKLMLFGNLTFLEINLISSKNIITMASEANKTTDLK